MNKNSQNPTEQIQADKAQAQQEPVGYIRWKNGSAEYVTRKHLEHPDDESWHAVYTAPQPTENLKCKSTQKRLATLWGYVKQEPTKTDYARIQATSEKRARRAVRRLGGGS